MVLSSCRHKEKKVGLDVSREDLLGSAWLKSTTRGRELPATKVATLSSVTSPSRSFLPSSKFLKMTTPAALYSASTAASVVIPKGKSSMLPAADRKALAPSLSTLSKKPTMAMSLSAMKAFASSTVARVLAGGPVFFSSQETIVSAVRPPLYSVSLPFLKNLRVG